MIGPWLQQSVQYQSANFKMLLLQVHFLIEKRSQELIALCCKFKQNAKWVKWVDDVLLAATESRCQDQAAEWIFHYLGKCNHDAFFTTASSHWIVLCSKAMDAYSACAIWEEANMPLRAQRVILCQLPISLVSAFPDQRDKFESLKLVHNIWFLIQLQWRETITYWYRKIDQDILDCLQTELKFRG